MAESIAAYRAYQDECEWILFDPKSGTIKDWIVEVKPSKIELTRDKIAWIHVANPHEERENMEFNKTEYVNILDKLSEERHRQRNEGIQHIKIPSDMYNRCLEEIFDVAKKQKDTCGKWMLFVNPKHIDGAWAKIAKATFAGKLGCAAKVSTSSNVEKAHLICVYTSDFTNKDKVKELLQGIQAMGLTTSNGFKPDVFTRLGIYKKNEWGLRPTIYNEMTSK